MGGQEAFVPDLIGDIDSKLVHVYRNEEGQCAEVGEIDKKKRIYFDRLKTAESRGYTKCSQCTWPGIKK